MARRGLIIVLGALLLGSCSSMSLPFIGLGGPHLTNPAVEACKSKADDLGYDGIGERQSAPTGGGRYKVVLDVRGPNGYGTVTCTYDPAKGATMPPPPGAGK